MNKKLLVFNWKMNPKTLKEARILAKASDFKNAVIAPPFVFTEETGKILKKAKLGAQDIFYESKGAFTGEISADELKKLGVKYVIIGHSERRRILSETDEMINKKVLAALKAKLKVILCVGEPLAIRKKGKKAVENYIKKQLQKDLKDIHKTFCEIIFQGENRKFGARRSLKKFDSIQRIQQISRTSHKSMEANYFLSKNNLLYFWMILFFVKNKIISPNLRFAAEKVILQKVYNSLIIAYEPIWAIGTRNYCKPENASEIIKFIKNILNSKFRILNSRILYGGSVDSKNIKNFLKYGEIDGFLIGGASLKTKKIKSIIKSI